jgi:hypothetical protein
MKYKNNILIYIFFILGFLTAYMAIMSGNEPKSHPNESNLSGEIAAENKYNSEKPKRKQKKRNDANPPSLFTSLNFNSKIKRKNMLNKKKPKNIMNPLAVIILLGCMKATEE